MLSVLDKKLIRDLAKLSAQVLAIAMVLACGVATIVIGVGAHKSLEVTQEAFYERYLFGNLFADVSRAPKRIERRIVQIDDVIAAESRVVKPVIIDIVGMKEPASGLVVSLPDFREPTVNRVYLRRGRLPSPGDAHEVAVLDRFAEAHGFEVGDRFEVVMNGNKTSVTIVGTVLSPEFIYVIGPGDMVPDDRRFAVLFQSEKVLAGVFDMEGAFNSVSVRTARNANQKAVLDQMDAILKPYGGAGGYLREDQISHAFLQAELDQLDAMARIIPPIFLFVAAFLVNMILERLISLEREQIGLLKAMGYSNFQVGLHYAKLVTVIGIIGLVIGSAFGSWGGRALTRLFGEIYTFPFLIFQSNLDLYLIAGSLSIAAALAGASKAIWSIVSLPPAVAMRPPAPTTYHTIGLGGLQRIKIFSRLTIMALRHLLRWPVRTGLTILGTSLSVALLVTSFFSYDSLDAMIDNIFFQTARQDATISLNLDSPERTLHAIRNLPGVLKIEPFRQTPIAMINGVVEEKTSLSSVVSGAKLSRILDLDQHPIDPAKNGLFVSERLLRKLDLKVGDIAEISLTDRDGRMVRLPVVAALHGYVGMGAYTDADTINRLLRDGRRVSGAHVLLDHNLLDQTYEAIKQTPAISSIALLEPSRKNLENTIDENITNMTSVYVGLAVIITFGVIYNSARIQLSERARELASLRVFGFTRGEVSSVLMTELAVIVLLAQPLGWLMGGFFASLVVTGFESDLFRIPLVINQSTYANASFIVLAAALFSALIVRRRIDRLDLIRVLKTRE